MQWHQLDHMQTICIRQITITRSFTGQVLFLTPKKQCQSTEVHNTRICYFMQLHTHPFNGPLSETTRVGRYQKGQINLDFTEATDSEWQWHQLGRMQVCTSLQTDNHASTPPLKLFTGQMPFLLPNQQRHITEGLYMNNIYMQLIYEETVTAWFKDHRTVKLTIHVLDKGQAVLFDLLPAIKKVKVAHTRLPSVGFRS